MGFKKIFVAGFSISLKLISQFVLNKIFAIYFGASQYYIVANFQNTMTIINTIGTGGINIGITKLSATSANYHKNLKQILTSSLIIIICFSLIIACGLIVFNNQITKLLFTYVTPAYKWITYLYSITIFSFTINKGMLAFLNGISKKNEYLIADILNTAIILLSTLLWVFFYSQTGVYLGLVCSNFAAILITLLFFPRRLLFEKFKLYPKKIRRLLNFSIGTFLTSIFWPISLIFIRGILLESRENQFVSIWDGYNKLSAIYTLFITYYLGSVYLPKVSKSKESRFINDYSKNIFFKLLFVSLLSYIAFVIFDGFFLELIFNKDFRSGEKYSILASISDVSKLPIWFYSFYLISTERIKEFTSIELISSLSLISLNLLLLKYLEASPYYAVLINNLILYLIILKNINKNGHYFKD